MNKPKRKPRNLWDVRCAVRSCGKTKVQMPELVFFKFPDQDDEMCKKWLDACSLQERPKPKDAYVCSFHFGINDVGKKRFKHQPLLPTLNLQNGASNSGNISVGYGATQKNYCQLEPPGPRAIVTAQVVSTDEAMHGSLFEGAAYDLEPMSICETENIEQPVEIYTDEQAAEYLRKLEQYCVLKENFQAIGLIAQLEQLFKGQLET